MGLKNLWVVSMKQQQRRRFAINENLLFVAITLESSSRSGNPSCQKQEILLHPKWKGTGCGNMQIDIINGFKFEYIKDQNILKTV